MLDDALWYSRRNATYITQIAVQNTFTRSGAAVRRTPLIYAVLAARRARDLQQNGGADAKLVIMQFQR